MNNAIQQYQVSDQNWWDDYIWRADNGSIFHTRRFLSYHPKNRFTDHSLIFKKGNSVKAVLPAVELITNDEKVLYSHRGSSYGGFVYQDAGIRSAFDLVEDLKEYAKAQYFKRIIITLPPLIYMTKYSNYIDFAMIKNGFNYIRREISSVLQLPGDKDQIFDLFKPEARTATRKSMRQNIEIRICDDYDDYYEILKNNLKLRHDVTPTHSLSELKKLVKLFPDKIHLWGAYLEGRLIAGVVNFLCTDDVVLAFYISDDKTFQEYRSVNNLFFHIFQWAVEHKFKFFDFGIFTVNMDPNWGLGKFKESFGARGLFRDTFEIVL